MCLYFSFFISLLDLEHYEKFLNAYSEHEWKSLRASLTAEEKNYWPQTVTQQTLAIQTIKNNAENVKNLAFGINVAADFIFPPAAFIHVAEAIYTNYYGVHPIIDEEITKGFKKYLEKNFKIVFDE
jgi:ABC-type uncharacterized transport system permease subunit